MVAKLEHKRAASPPLLTVHLGYDEEAPFGSTAPEGPPLLQDVHGDPLLGATSDVHADALSMSTALGGATLASDVH